MFPSLQRESQVINGMVVGVFLVGNPIREEINLHTSDSLSEKACIVLGVSRQQMDLKGKMLGFNLRLMLSVT